LVLLSVNNINTYRGASHILVNVSLKLNEGEVLCLLGRNGAGKTTTMESIMGMTPPYTGSIKFKGIELVEEERNPYKCTTIVSDICRLGIGFVPEGRRIFSNLSVRENLLVARKKASAVGAGGEVKDREHWTEARIYGLFPKLKDMRNKMAHYMSGGEKQMLTISRALMGNPDLVLLDEPSEGLAPAVTMQLNEQLNKLKTMGMSMIITEQNLNFVSNLGTHVAILENGAIKFQDTIAGFLKNKNVQHRYLAI
jgi:branched-chain amino acid transport system ATP-binding protein